MRVKHGIKNKKFFKLVEAKIVVIQEDQDGVLVFGQQHLKYYMKRALKRLLNLKPSTAILGSSHTIVHVILWLTDV